MPESAADYWNRRAAHYDALAWVHDRDLVAWTASAMVLGATPRRILDVGCGTGVLTRALAWATRPNGRVLGVDISPAMVSRARARGQDPTVEFALVDDATDAGRRRPDGAGWDLVAARMVLHHAPDPAAAVAQWLDLAGTGGALAIAEGVPPAGLGAPSAALFREALEAKEPGRHVFDAATVAQWMLDAGARVVSTHERYTQGNSTRNWLSGQGAPAELVERLMDLHRRAAADPAIAREYAMVATADDVLMRWRHAVVVGRR